MTTRIVECVPNFSEGRDPAKVDAIVEAMKLPGVFVLDREMDADHNRCVITLAGECDALLEAAIRGVGKAAELIDLNKHQGVHPRIGACDVVPFIPIEGVSMEDCVDLARRAGEEIWKRFNIPVYLYEDAATSPERQKLENIRRGQFEGLREEIAINPARRPDFGEWRLHPTAGATAVGARKLLIAYNIFLNTADIGIATNIARTVRFSSGGLRYVKASGFLVRGMAQVSMNLTDFEQTPIHRVFELVRCEAARYGFVPVSSEIVGLIPKLALEQAAAWFLEVENFNSSVILENRLAGAMGASRAPGLSSAGCITGWDRLLEQLAAPIATPGGGSAAAAAGAMAAALAARAVSISRGQKAYLNHETGFSDALARLTELRRVLKTAVDADAAACGRVAQTYEVTKQTPGSNSAIAALRQAASVPLDVAEHSAEIVRLAEQLRSITHATMSSELTTAIALAGAAVTGALASAEIALAAMERVAPQEKEFLSEARARAASVVR